MNKNTIAHLLDLLKKDLQEAQANYDDALKIEEGSDSDSMLSMDRAYAEGMLEGIELVIRTIEEEAM